MFYKWFFCSGSYDVILSNRIQHLQKSDLKLKLSLDKEHKMSNLSNYIISLVYTTKSCDKMFLPAVISSISVFHWSDYIRG